MREVVVPNIVASQGISNRVADVLALPLLWAAIEPEMESRMPETTRNRVRDAYALIRTLDQGVNPVRKRFLIVSGRNAQVHITVAPGNDGGNNNLNIGHVGGGAGGLDAVHARLHAVEIGQISIREEMTRNQQDMLRKLDMVNRNVRRIAIQPGARQAAGNHAVGPGAARLSANPRTLYALWNEYTVGIGGRKAARLFSAQERGREKYKFHRRKVVWEVINRLIRSGRTAQTAIDMIYAVYGHVSVTTIINRMRQDRALGGHPNLE